MEISVLPDLTTGIVAITHWADILQAAHAHLPMDIAVLDKPIEVDLFGDVGKAINHFVKTGQVWAFLIGIILGYLFRTFTTYG